jgi:hypothetical protein
MATSGTLPSQVGAWRELYLAALLEADMDKTPNRIAEAERAMVDRARELFKASGDNIQEEEALDDALYALRALKSCLAINSGLAA